MSTLSRLLLLFIMFVANPVSAAVVINEVAWMGDSSSANHEWIELYNNGAESVSVDGWVLSDLANLSVGLSGNITAGAYSVLERTSEESAPGAAFLIYTGALVNNGTTLILKNSDGQIMDQVSGGVDWEGIGGDNITKNTAQYTTAGWVTDTPTPGAANRSGVVAEVKATSTPSNIVSGSSGGSTPSASKSKASASVKTNNEETVLKLITTVQDVAYVNQTVPFLATISGLEESERIQADYEWNFGDSYTGNTRKVEHSYKYPGSYVVTVFARYKKEEQVARHEITVLPVSFSLARNDKGDIQIHNNSAYDVDISGYTLRGVKDLVLAPRTIIMPRATLTIEAWRLGGMTNSLIAFYDSKNTLVTSTFKENNLLFTSPTYENNKQETISAPVVSGLNKVSPPSVVKDNNFSFIAKEAEAKEAPVEKNEEINNPDQQLAVEDDSDPFSKKWPYLVFIGMMLLALFGIFATKAKDN